MTKQFRACRYEVREHAPSKEVLLWSRHLSLGAAERSFREVVNNQRGDHMPGTLIELRDVVEGTCLQEGRAGIGR